MTTPAASAADPSSVALPPETVEGWYALHQMYRIDRAALRLLDPAERAALRAEAADAFRALATEMGDGWTAVVELVGSPADVMLMHFRPTLDAVGEVQRHFERSPLADHLERVYSFLSVTEAGMYHLTARLAREARERGGAVGDDEYRAALARSVAEETGSDHVRRRLYPQPPAAMPYVCFYPMDKRRDEGQNWYALSLDERSRLMYAHGTTGRRYAGRVLQVITGAIGLDAWEWGVTLFAGDPLLFKKLVTEMRFDEASARYALFGDFWVGRIVEAGEWLERELGA